MLTAIEPEKAVKTLDGYFNLLRSTGYLKRPAVMRFLVYCYLADFVDVMSEYMTELEYNNVCLLLRKMFSSGCCLMPYSTCAKRYVVGMNGIMNAGLVRVNEERQNIRHTEDDDVRITER